MKKIKFKVLSIIFSILYFLPLAVFADAVVTIVPKTEITTSKPDLKEGDTVEFVVSKDVFVNNKLKIKEGSIVEGIVTYIEPNTWAGNEAKLTIEQFFIRDRNNQRIKLIGNVYKAGDNHDGCLEFLQVWIIRGGEVQIKPEKDSFNLFVKEIL